MEFETLDDNTLFDISYEQKSRKEKPISMFHYEDWRSGLSECLTTLSEKHKEERKKLIPANVELISGEERKQIVDRINEQLVELGEHAYYWLDNQHLNHQEATGEPLYQSYSTKPFLLCKSSKLDDDTTEEEDSNRLERPKMVVVLASPSLSQLKSNCLDPSLEFPNELRSIETRLQTYANKTFAFVFSIPFFLGTDEIKEDIVSSPSIFKPIMLYTRDLMRVLNPMCIVAVTALALERCLNKFEEKGSRDTIRKNTSLFSAHMKDALKDECEIAINRNAKIKCYYLPHPYSLKVKYANPRLQEDTDNTWALIDRVWPVKKASLLIKLSAEEQKQEQQKTLQEAQTKTLQLLKQGGDILFPLVKVKKPSSKDEVEATNEDESAPAKNIDVESKVTAPKAIRKNSDLIKLKKTPVRKLPKGKRYSMGIDSFIVKKTIEK